MLPLNVCFSFILYLQFLLIQVFYHFSNNITCYIMLEVSFDSVDFIVFLSTILVSLSIGIFYAFRGQNTNTTNEYLLADRKMGFAPVSMSLLVTIMSAITVLGVPAIVYQGGTSYWGFCFSYFLFIPILAHCVMPVLYDLKLVSAYEYLEKRFSKEVKLCGTVSYILMMVVYMGVVLYAPALALNAVTGLNIWISVVTLCTTCAIYTTVGGMRAVIWTDVFQACVMLLSQILVLSIGVTKLGGFQNVFKIAMENNKIPEIDLNPSPFVPHTFWSLTIGGTFLCLNIYGTNQGAVQRFLCCKSKKDAQMMIWLNFPLLQLVMVLGCVIGLVMFAEFRCDNPMAHGRQADQLLIYYVMHVLKEYHGLSGLFVGCLFAASLSTISSCFNSLATVTFKDLIKPHVNIAEKWDTTVAKVLVCVYAFVCLLMTLIASQVDSLLKAALSILGVMGGPLLSMFLIGMCCRHVNSKGMLAGFVSSMISVFLIGYGALIYRQQHSTQINYKEQLDPSCIKNIANNVTTVATTAVSTFGYNVTVFSNSTDASSSVGEMYTGIYYLFKLSYMWYSGLSFFITFTVSTVISYFTKSSKDVVDEACLMSYFKSPCPGNIENKELCILESSQKLIIVENVL